MNNYITELNKVIKMKFYWIFLPYPMAIIITILLNSDLRESIATGRFGGDADEFATYALLFIIMGISMFPTIVATIPIIIFNGVMKKYLAYGFWILAFFNSFAFYALYEAVERCC